MTRFYLLPFCLLPFRLLSACVCLAGPAAAEPLAVFETRDHVGRDWPRTLVTYDLARSAKPFKAGEAKLIDADTGNEVPYQLSRVQVEGDVVKGGRISFYASLAAGGRYRYELQPGLPAAMKSPAAVTEGGLLTLDNGAIAIRLPAGTATPAEPLRFGTDQAEMVALYGRQAEKGIAPGPIQGIRLADGRWVGGSYFWAAEPAAAPRVAGWEARITEQGPLFVEATIRYRFTEPGGAAATGEPAWYACTVRLLADDPAVRIDEQFDMQSAGSMWDYRLMVSLGNGWKPAEARWFSPRNADSARGLDDATTGELFKLAVRYPWTPAAHFFGLFATAAKGEPVASLGVVPLHAGNWRGSADESDGMVWGYDCGDVCLNWRLRASRHPRSLLHTGEYDPALPLTFCRRQWALVGGTSLGLAPLERLRRTEGFITLDDMKDWVVDWPADPAVAYPRLLFTKSDVERVKPQLAAIPGGDDLAKFLYFDDSEARRKELFAQLTGKSEWSGPSGLVHGILDRGDPPSMPWVSHYRLTQMAGFAGSLDELLSSASLPADERARIRRDIAAACELLSEPDVNPRGSLTHLGNPNMPINRFMALTFLAALIPDHPRATEWLDTSAAMLRYKLAMNTAPGGCWSELVTYFGASAPHIMQAAAVLAASGRGDDRVARLSALPAEFTARLLASPDPRFGGRRMLPNWGHEGADTLTHWLVAAANLRQIDPQAAADFVWDWNAQGRPMNQHHDAGFSPRAILYAGLFKSVLDESMHVPPTLASSWLPGFGAVLRGHAGDPLETYLSLRQGYMVSHCDPNQGDFVLSAKGAPLVTLSLHAYPLQQIPVVGELDKTFGWQSRVRFGSAGNTGGWPGGGATGGLPAWSFDDSIDYVRGVGTYPPQDWTRQVAYLKGRTAAGPQVLVFRDSFATPDKQAEPAFWTLRTLGTPAQAEPLKTDGGAIGLDYRSAFGPRLAVRVLEPGPLALKSKEAKYAAPLYFGSASNWLAGLPVKAKEANETNVSVEESITVHTFGPVAAGRDVTVTLLPLAADEKPPVVESIGPGAVKVTTAESTDYVFLGRAPFEHAGGDVAFSGQAGAIRVRPDAVEFASLEGPAMLSFKGAVVKAAGPGRKVVAVADLAKKPMVEIPAAPVSLPEATLPAGCSVSGDVRCQVTIERDRIVGKSSGRGGFLHAPMPAGLAVLPMLVIDGQTYAPGTSGDRLIIPLMPGDHAFEVKALEQPPVFRNWQAWE